MVDKELLAIFGVKYLEGVLHLHDGVVDIFAEVHVFNGVDAGLFEMPEPFDF